MHQTILLLCSVIMLHTITNSSPLPGFTGPQRTVMFGGYYGYPYEGRGYNPQGTMTAFASGDTIATNSFVGDELSGRRSSSPSAEETSRSLEATQSSEEEDDDDEVFIDVETTTAAKPKNNKRIPKRKNKQDDSEDNDSPWPFNSRNGPSYNSFFPIMFGGGQAGSRTRSGEGSSDGHYPGGATAIANSFSTGKGGVATSHATSFGDPYNLLKSGFFNTKNGNNPQPQHRQ